MAPFPLLLSRQYSLGVPEDLLQNFVQESRAPQVVVGNAVVQIVGTLLFFARICSRFIIINSWKSEDSVLVVAWLFATAFSICQYAQVRHGAGRHLSVILKENPEDTIMSQKYAFAAQIIAIFAMALPKISICLTYLGIFQSDVRGRRMIKGVIGFIVVPSLVFIILSLFQCTPIQVYWTEGRPASKCSTNISGIYVGGGINVLVDVVLIAIVLPRVLELHLHSRQKWALVGIVCLGSLAALAGMTRMIRVGMTLQKPNFDATWDAYDISIWTSTEIYVSLICASAPGIKPIAAKLLPKLLESSTYGQSRPTTTTQCPPDSIELSLKKRRGTIGTQRVRAHLRNDTVLKIEAGLYQQVGRGTDSISPNISRIENRNEDYSALGTARR